MNAWAALDHAIRYKPTVPIVDESYCERYFKVFGTVLHELDHDVMEARDKFDGKIKADDIE